MSSQIIALLLMLSLLITATAIAEEKRQEQLLEEKIEALNEPLYSPFIERYMLDEIKRLRISMAELRVDLNRQMTDRELKITDRAVSYATDTVTYFFYLIAAASSVLVLIGWSSMRDIKEKAHTLADKEVGRLIEQYEQRLAKLESSLRQKTQSIEENREEIELTQEIQSLWLRAGQEASPSNRISIYDQILNLRPEDCEALTYKADAALELDQPLWAINLCNRALEQESSHSQAFFQLACANTVLGQYEEAIAYLKQAIENSSDSYTHDVLDDPALEALADMPEFKAIRDQA